MDENIIKWEIKLNNDLILEDNVDGRYWLKVQEFLEDNQLKIVEMNLIQGNNKYSIDQSADGYFFGKKIVALLNENLQVNLLGIGYYRKCDEKVRILWYNENMEFIENEVRETSQAGFFLVKNYH